MHQMANVNEVICSDEPTEKYHKNLQLPSIPEFKLNVSALFLKKKLDGTKRTSCSMIRHI